MDGDNEINNIISKAMTLITAKSKSIPKRVIIGLEETGTAAKNSGAGGGYETNRVKCSSSDNSAGYLDSKIAAGAGITKTKTTDANGNEKIVISSSNTLIFNNKNGLTVDELVCLDNEGTPITVNDSNTYPIGIISAINGTDCTVTTSGVIELSHDFFIINDVGSLAYWNGTGYDTNENFAYPFTVGIVIDTNKIFVEINRITDGRAAVDGSDTPAFLGDKIVAGNGIGITQTTGGAGAALQIYAQSQLPSMTGEGGHLLTNNGMAAGWTDGVVVDNDYTTVNRTLIIAKQGEETGGAAAQSIYMPQYTTVDGTGGLFVRNNGTMTIYENASKSYIELSNGAAYFGRQDAATQFYGIAIMPHGTHRGAWLSTPESATARRIMVTDDNNYVYRAPAGDHIVKTAQITLTRAQIVALYTTPIQFIANRSGVCKLPIKAVQKQGAVRYYTGIVSLCFGTTYSSSKVLANIGLSSGVASARFVNCVTPTTQDCENIPIYLTASSAITDGGNSDPVTFYLEYTELYL